MSLGPAFWPASVSLPTAKGDSSALVQALQHPWGCSPPCIATSGLCAMLAQHKIQGRMRDAERLGHPWELSH